MGIGMHTPIMVRVGVRVRERVRVKRGTHVGVHIEIHLGRDIGIHTRILLIDRYTYIARRDTYRDTPEDTSRDIPRDAYRDAHRETSRDSGTSPCRDRDTPRERAAYMDWNKNGDRLVCHVWSRRGEGGQAAGLG